MQITQAANFYFLVSNLSEDLLQVSSSRDQEANKLSLIAKAGTRRCRKSLVFTETFWSCTSKVKAEILQVLYDFGFSLPFYCLEQWSESGITP